MGYLKKNHAKVLKAIQNLKDKRYSWVDDNFHKINDLKDILEAWRWSPGFNEAGSGDIEEIEFTGEKAGDDFVLFDAIASFVEKGSFIEMVGEDGEMWRWLFDGKHCSEQKAKITYEWEEL